MPLQCTKSKRAVDFYRPLIATSKRRERRAPSLNYAKLNKSFYNRWHVDMFRNTSLVSQYERPTSDVG